jgi:hypothetical protein
MDSEIAREEELLFEEWDIEDEEVETSPAARWRRPVVVAVSIVVALSIALLPLYNLFDGRNPPIAENGLEICGYDYCTVYDAVVEAGLDLEMSRLANLILDDAEASLMAIALTSYLGIEEVELLVVDQLGARLGGVYDPATRSILIERPANAWVVTHEIAHAVAAGHGPDFQDVIIELTEWLADQT